MPHHINNSKPQRNTNIEWLRIIAMIMIVAYHAMRNGYATIDKPLLQYSYGIIVGGWGLLGVDIFLIISAWFLSAQEFRFKKVIHLVFQVFTWVLIYAVAYFAYQLLFCNMGGLETFVGFLEHCLNGLLQPLWAGAYWFVTAYFFMLLLSPLLNRLLSITDKTKMRKILLIFVFIPIYANFRSGMIGDVFSFLYVYLLVGYIRRYGSALIDKYAKPRYFTSLMAIAVVAKIALKYLQDQFVAQNFLKTILSSTLANTGRHSLMVLIIALLIFFYVEKKEPTYNKTVNTVASCTLGVYLFHEASLFALPQTTDYVFSKLEEIGYLTMGPLFPLQHFSIVIAVFAIGVILELIRDRVIQRPFMKWVDKKYSGQIAKVDKWFNDFNPS